MADAASGDGGLRLRAALHRHPDAATIVVSASGRVFRVDMAAEDLVGALSRGGLPDGSTAEVARGFSTIVETLQRDGCLGGEPGPAGWLRFREDAIDPEATLRTSLVVVGSGDPAALAMDLLPRDLAGRFAETVWCDLRSLDRVVGERDAHATVVVALSDHFDHELLTSIDDHAAASGVRWIPFHLDAGRGWLGPAIVPAETPSYRDLFARRMATAKSLALFHALTGPPVHRGPRVPTHAELRWMLSILMADVERWIVGVAPASSWRELELDPVTFAVTPHPVLPLPDGGARRPPRHLDMEDLVDERTGIVNRVEPLRGHPSLPGALRIVQSVACDMTRISYCTNGRSNHGSSFVSERAARAAAIAECVERYCGNWVDASRLVEATHDELVADGQHAVDPERLVLHSAAQYAAAGFPFVPFTRHLRVHWVRGVCLTCDRPAWIPASLVHVNWYLGAHVDDPPTNYAMFSGIAAGPTWDAALASGLEEVIERDATMIWWLNAQRLPGVRPTPALEAIWEGTPAELGQRAWLVHLDNEFDVPVLAGIVENIREGFLTIGFAARPDPADAALKAWAEALALQETSRWMQDADGPFWRGGDLVDTASLKPPREDRRYLDVVRSDFHDVHTLMGQLQVHLDPRARELVRPWVDVDPVRPLSSLPRVPERTSAAYRSRLERRGFEVFAVDMTTSDIATTNLRVARVVVPGLVPNLPAAFPPLGGRRVRDVPVALGWRARPLEEAELNIFPLPHA